MYKIEIKNASVKDMGYGLDVNGKPLNEIISTLLGTKVGDTIAWSSKKLEAFSHNSCDITVIIEPHPTEVHLEEDRFDYESVKEMEDFKREQFNKKNQKTDAEE